MLLLDAHLAVKDHEALEDAKRACRVVGHLGLAVVKALPRQGLAAREQEKEKAAAPEPRKDQAQAEPPERPCRKCLPPGMGTAVRSKASGENDDEAGNGANNSEHGSDADGLKGAVADAEADKVTM